MIAWLLVAVALADDPSDVDGPVDPPAVPPEVEEQIGVPGAQTAQEADPDNPTTDKLLQIDDEVDEVGDGDDGISPEGYIEVLVIGEQQITAARDAVVREMEGLGWRTRRRADGSVVFRGPESWMGRATLLPSGDLDFDQPAIALQGPRETLGGYSDDAIRENRFQGGTAGIAVALPSKDKVDAVQRDIRAAVQDEVLDFRRKLQQRYFSSYIAELPARLDAVWSLGTPLDGGRKALATPEAKRAAILEFWATRTDTPEGRTVSRAVEIWLRETVMATAEPVTPTEAAAAEARREDGRRLDVFDGGAAVMTSAPTE